ncbi:MAG: hypothetical protein UIG59_03150 [Acutalibacteraceae bacterium]|nr:hypothetical protein [Acutalibacteraceae bacterium]
MKKFFASDAQNDRFYSKQKTVCIEMIHTVFYSMFSAGHRVDRPLRVSIP